MKKGEQEIIIAGEGTAKRRAERPKGKLGDVVVLKNGTNYAVTTHLLGKKVDKNAVKIISQGVVSWEL